jgi:Rrf2 family iron-sulfur cluster assembly transcriptional regulator
MILGLSEKQVAAIDAVLDIALHGGAAAVRSGEITKRHDIPRRYLEPVLQQLSRADILVGIRGPNGGYRLARERRHITLGDLIRAIAPQDNVGDDARVPSQPAVEEVLADLAKDVMDRLDGITVEKLCWRVQEAGQTGPETHDYTI